MQSMFHNSDIILFIVKFKRSAFHLYHKFGRRGLRRKCICNQCISKSMYLASTQNRKKTMKRYCHINMMPFSSKNVDKYHDKDKSNSISIIDIFE